MPPRGRVPTLKDCSVPGCKNSVICKGLCHAHYQAQREALKRAAKRERVQPSSDRGAA